MKKILGSMIKILGVVGGLYVGGWLMFILPIIEACIAFDANALTGVIIGTAVIKCIFASFVGWLICMIGFIIGSKLTMDDFMSRRRYRNK